jgi:PAS domain S-box-containing protein
MEWNGKTAVLSRATDVTERKGMEEEDQRASQFMETILENANVCFNVLDENANVMAWNKAAELMSGYTREEVLGHAKIWEWLYPDEEYRKSITDAVADVMRRGRFDQDLESTIKRKDGQIRIISWNQRNLLDEHGKVTGSIAFGRDITERKQAEQALRESEGRFRAILDAVNDGILVADVENKRFYLGNKAICRMLGYRPEDIKNLGVMDIHPKESFPYVTEQFDRLARHEIGVATEIPVKRRDGSIFYADISPSFLTMAGRTYLVGVFRDISERKRVERTLRESEELYRHLIERQGEGLAILDLEDRFTFCNPRGDEIFGVSPGGMVGRTTQEFTTPETFEFIKKQTEKRLAGEKSTYEIEILRPDGDKRHLLVTAAPWLDKDGHVIGSVAIFRDETDRKRAEEEIRRLNQLRETIIDNANVWLDVLDENANVVVWNKAAEVISGYSREEVVGHAKIWEWLYPDEEYRKQLIDLVADVIKRGRVEEDFETRIRRKDGQIRIISWNERNLLDEHGKAIGSIAVGRDVTERKRMEQEIQRASQFVKTILDNANVSFNVLDENANVVVWNKAAELMTGYTREEVLGHAKIWEWLYPDEEYRKQLIDRVADVMRRGRFDQDIETRIRRKDGQIRIISWNQRSLLDEDGKPIGSIAIGRDVTERKRMQEELERHAKHLEELVAERTRELRESEEKYRSLVENIPDVAWTTDRDGRTVFVSPNVVNVSGRTPEEIYAAGGTLWLERMHPDDKERVKEAYEALFARNQPYDIEYRIQRKDGGWIWLHDRSVATYEKDGRRYADGLLSDITERKRMEQQVEEGMLRLRESEAKFRALYDSIADGIIYNDVPGRIFDCNRAFEKMVGYSLDELRNMKWQDITPKQYLELEEGIVKEEMLKRGFSTYVEKEYIRKDGSTIAVETTASIIRGVGGKPDMIWCIVRDITQRKRAERQVEEAILNLKESEAKFRGLYESIRDGIMANDVSGRIYDCNKAFQNMVGYSLEELRNMRYQDITPEQYCELEDRITREEMVRGGFSGYVEKEYIRKNGTRVPVEVAASLVKGTGGKPDMIWCIIRDITERKRMEEDLMKSQRLATIGEVAAMVGHDLRNPLQVLTNALYLLEESFKTQPSSQTVELLEKNRPALVESMEEQIGYMNKIVSDLQDYARPLKPELAPTNLRRLIDEILSTAGVPISIDVSIEIEENVQELNIDHGLMKRAFTNLVTNAVQAMPHGGRLTIRALKADKMGLISIQDTGAGIPKENLDKVFTPMFSTKAKGQGFGLAACKRIVEAHNGKISLESTVGKGTTVFIKIPIAEVG